MVKYSLVAVAMVMSGSTLAGGFKFGDTTEINNNPSSTAIGVGGAAQAYSGSASRASANVFNRTSNSQSQGQFQGQSTQSRFEGTQSGFGSGNDTSVRVEGDTYEAAKKADVPAYAPDAVAAPATAPCIKTWAASGGGMGIVSIGGSGYVKDHGCAFGEVARRAHAQGNGAVAEYALMKMLEITMAEAGEGEEPQAAPVKAATKYSDSNDIVARPYDF